MNAEIIKLYEENDFPGIDKLYKLAKKKGLKVSLKDIGNALLNIKTYQLFKKPPKRKNRPIVAAGNNIEHQMDLLDMSKFYNTNSHYRYILIMIDIFSRRGFAEPLKTKSAANTLEGIKKGFENLEIVASDNGTEFKGVVSEYLKRIIFIRK